MNCLPRQPRLYTVCNILYAAYCQLKYLGACSVYAAMETSSAGPWSGKARIRAVRVSTDWRCQLRAIIGFVRNCAMSRVKMLHKIIASEAPHAMGLSGNIDTMEEVHGQS
jgi:hypothetical protein